MSAQVVLNLDLSSILRPAQGRTLIDLILHVQSRTAFDQQLHNRIITGQGRLMLRCRMRMGSVRVISVWILACIEKQRYDACMPMLRCQRECAVTGISIGCRKQAPSIVKPSQPSSDSNVLYLCASPNKGLGSARVPERECRHQR